MPGWRQGGPLGRARERLDSGECWHLARIGPVRRDDLLLNEYKAKAAAKEEEEKDDEPFVFLPLQVKGGFVGPK